MRSPDRTRGRFWLGTLMLLLGGATAAALAGGDTATPGSATDLVHEVQGFGDKTTGGRGGELTWVTTLADAGPGSLRSAAEDASRRWIRFRVSGTLPLLTPIAVASDKTIDGRGTKITITGRGLVIDGQSNVIVENLLFADGEDDAVHVVNGARNVWIDHCSLSHWSDGLIDITRASTDITISWCRFSHHDKVVLIGASPVERGDTVMRVTLHHNHFERTTERHPRLRFGKVHAYNNYYEAWGSYGAASSMLGELLSQANIYEAGWDKDAIITRSGRDPEEGYVRSVGDLALGGAHVVEREPGHVFDPARFYSSARVAPADETLKEQIRREAGWRDVALGP